MKFFHLSDLHIGRQLHFYSLKEDQRRILEEIVQYVYREKPQAIVIAGDVYDKSVPSAEAVAVFDEFIRKLSETGVQILVISGNHDSPERLDFASSLLEKQNLHMAGLPPMQPQDHIRKVRLQDAYGPVNFWLLPFVKPSYVSGITGPGLSYTDMIRALLERESREEQERHVLVTHQFYTASGREPARSESEAVYVGGAGNVDVSAVQQFDYVAMGHIHKGQSIGGEQFRYCGTPLKYSVSESGDVKGLTMVTLEEKGTPPRIEVLPLHPPRDVLRLCGCLKELMLQGSEDYVSITLTDEKVPYQPREQLGQVFPNLLELRVDNPAARRTLEKEEQPELPDDPLQMFRRFFLEIQGEEMDGQETELMERVIRKIQEEMQ